MNMVSQCGEAFENAFRKNIALRGCSYDPTGNYEHETDDNGQTRSFLRNCYKLLWFHTYCAENNLQGYILGDDYTFTNLQDYGWVTVKAKVVINGVIVATASAAQSFKVGDTIAMDGALQAASSIAVSRALSNAGFGVISGFDAQAPGGNPAEGVIPPAPIPAPAGNGEMRNPLPFITQPATYATNTAASVDPIAAAKATIWEGNGQYKGKTLGELLATNPRQIVYIAQNWHGTGPVKDAACRLLPEAKRLCGIA